MTTTRAKGSSRWARATAPVSAAMASGPVGTISALVSDNIIAYVMTLPGWCQCRNRPGKRLPGIARRPAMRRDSDVRCVAASAARG